MPSLEKKSWCCGERHRRKGWESSLLSNLSEMLPAGHCLFGLQCSLLLREETRGEKRVRQSLWVAGVGGGMQHSPMHWIVACNSWMRRSVCQLELYAVLQCNEWFFMFCQYNMLRTSLYFNEQIKGHGYHLEPTGCHKVMTGKKQTNKKQNKETTKNKTTTYLNFFQLSSRTLLITFG